MTLLIGSFCVLIGLLLGLLGGGGSVLTVPMLVYLAHLEPKAAIATSLLAVGVTSCLAVLPNARLGNVCWRAGAAFGGTAMAGAYAGGRLAAWIPGPLLLQGFGGMMLVTAIAMLLKRKDGGAAGATCPKRLWVLLAIAGLGAVVGTLTGLIGAGGGFMIVPALALLGGLPLRAAIGTSLLIIALNAFAGLVGYLSHEAIDWRFAAAVTGLTVAGSLAGNWLAPHTPTAVLRRSFGVVVLGVALYLLYRETSVADWVSRFY